MDIIAHPDMLDAMILWRMDDPRYATFDAINRKGTQMQRQWTIEARADFADAEKNEVITAAVRRAAVHINATLLLLSDGQKPQVVAFSDDYFSGHEDIGLIHDELGAAKAAHDATIPEGEVSDEMKQAFRDMQK